MRDFLRVGLMFFLVGIQFGFSQNKRELIAEITLNFTSESSIISEADTKKINTLIKDLKNSFSSYSIEISAHTDSQGSINYNKELAAKRAIASADFFVKNGFQNRKISHVSNGEFNPLSDNDSETGRAKNRRATIKIYQNEDDKIAIGGFTIKEKLYTIDTSNPQEVVYQSGTRITIPENAFEDKNGNPITGDVQLSYIEYRDPVDFILGNIPMDIKHDGENLHFNSGGMFKIKALKDGEEVFLKKDKPIDIDFPLVENLPDMNFYRFDEEKNKWEEIKKISKNNVGGVSDWSQVFYIEEEIDRVGSNRTFMGRNSSQEFYDFNCDKTFKNLNIGLHFSKSNDTICDQLLFVPKDSLKVYGKRIAISEIKIKKAKNKLNVFKEYKSRLNVYCSIDTDSVLKENEFRIHVKNVSGLQTLKKLIWSGNPDKLKEKKDNLILTKIEKVGDNKYHLFFKDSSQEYVLKDINLSPSNTVNTETIDYIFKYTKNVIKNFEDKGVKSQKTIELQSNQVSDLEKSNKILRKFKYKNDRSAEQIAKSLNEFWEFSKKYMDDDELKLEFKTWLKFFDDNKPKMQVRYESIKENPEFKECFKLAEEKEKIVQKNKQAGVLATNVTEKLSISNLGIYNCDQIQRLQEPITIYAEYENEQGEKVVPLFIYIVDKSINGILKYDGYNGYSPNKFAISSKSESTLLAFDGEGNAYIYNLEKMRGLRTVKNQSNNTLVISKIDAISNKDQLTALLN